MQTRTIFAVGATLVLSLSLAGCHIDTERNGDNKDVKIDTPFGGMHVKTNDAVVPQEIGLPLYPGATPAPKDNGNDDNTSADVNMSFGSFQLRVKAASFRTADAPDKVEAFYLNGLKRYGDVITCRGDRPVGSPAQTAEGLTCDNKKGNHISVENNVSGHKLELKAGSQQHQHVVTIDAEGSGAKFGLVALDLPGKMFSDDGQADRQ